MLSGYEGYLVLDAHVASDHLFGGDDAIEVNAGLMTIQTVYGDPVIHEDGAMAVICFATRGHNTSTARRAPKGVTALNERSC